MTDVRISLSECLAKNVSSDTPQALLAEKAAFIADMCRLPTDASDKILDAICNARVQNGFLAAAEFLASVDLSVATEEILSPPVKEFQAALPMLSAAPSAKPLEDPPVRDSLLERFCGMYAKQYSRVADKLVAFEARFEWSKKIIAFFDATLGAEQFNFHVVKGILEGFSEAGFFKQLTKEDIEHIVSLIDSGILKSDSDTLQECAFLAISRLVGLPNCPDGVVDTYAALAVSEESVEELLEPSFTLALRCAEAAPRHKANICSVVVATTKAAMKEQSADVADGLVFLFKLLQDHRDLFVDSDAGLLEDVIAFVSQSQGAAVNPDVQTAALKFICAVLKQRVNVADAEVLKRTVSNLLSAVNSRHRDIHSDEEDHSKRSSSMPQRGANGPALPRVTLNNSGAPAAPAAPDASNGGNDSRKNVGPELALLKAIALSFASDRKQTTEFIVSGLINAVTFPLCSCDMEILQCVLDIACSGVPSVVNDTVMLAVNVYKQLVSSEQNRIVPSATIISTLSAKLKDLAIALTDHTVKENACRKVLTLFHSLGQETKQSPSRRVEVSELPTVKAMASMLPFLAEFIQCNDEQIILHPDEAQQEAFRNAWFYCVFFDFALHGHASEDWQNPITRIAEKIPVLGINHNHELVKAELEISAILNNTIGREPSSVRKRLNSCLPNAAASIKALPPAFACFFLSIYYLEILRARSGEYRALFAYLEDFSEVDERTANYQIYQNMFQAISCAVFTELLAGLKARRYVEESESDLLASVVEYLLVHFCSNNLVVRQSSGQFLRMITDNFPQVFYHPRCAKTLLEIVDIVSHGREIGPLDKTHIQFPNNNVFLALPEDAAGMNSLFHETVQLAYNWINESLHLAPTETFSVLHAYMRSFSEGGRAITRQHYGVSLATEILSSAGRSVLTQHHSSAGAAYYSGAPAGAAGAVADVNTTVVLKRGEDELGSAFMTALIGKAHYFGELKSAQDMMSRKFEKEPDEKERKEKATDELAKVLLQQFDELEQKIDKKTEKSEKTDSALDGMVYRSCAFVIYNQTHPHATSLLNKIVWAPVRRFTPESLRVGTSAWSWLIPSLSRTLVEYLLCQMRLAWAWTIDCRLGLFTDAKRPPNPLAVPPKSASDEDNGNNSEVEVDEKELAEKKENERRRDCTPHRIWLDFLAERLIVAENVECLQIDIIFEMISRAISDPTRLSVLSESFGTRFKLLLLALECIKVVRERRFILAQYNKTADAKRRADAVDVLFLKRVYAAALAWFKEFPAWYEPPTKSELAEDVECVCRFCELLEGIINPNAAAAAAGSAGGRTSMDNSGLTVPRVSMSDTSSVRSGRSGRSARSGHNSTKSVSSAAGVRFASLVPPMSVPRYMQDARLPEGDNARATVQLLLCFLGDELERIRVWNNPLNIVALQLRMSVDPARLRNPQVSLPVLVDAAWALDPQLAVMLWVRNQSNEGVKARVKQKVLANPGQVAHCAEALPLLVSEESVRDNIPQLKYLLYWAPTDPLTAMSLLGRKYRANAFVTHYALRVLRQFSADTVIFYLPQLVQCLRYDDKGLVAEYLVDACRRSELLAHQLIWNTKTYPEKPPREGYKVDPDFAKRANRVRKRVIANFTKEQQERYEQEFQFFDRFTAISSRLLPIEPDERRNKLKEELRQIQPLSGDTVYMPFDPHIVVRSVDAESPLVLRSAEKVPIMVHFNVVEREHADTQKPFLHSCIFKSGDDVRQDMLAVQVIELLKRVFDGAGLHLFLFPYKIIATEPDCGMIEVVPNSLSRDQIGQKTDGTLYDYYLNKYGAKNSLAFQQARNNFIRSMAAYAIASYILQVKDRHNGNILIDDYGHLVHIDFGFLFDRTPGGDLKFERAPFKITDEMIRIMGGSPSSDQFSWFMEQGIRAFLAARDHFEGIVTLVDLMIDTQLPCFKPTSIQNLRARFFPGSSVPDAAKQMGAVMTYAFSTGGTFFTYFYDKFQEFDNGIAM